MLRDRGYEQADGAVEESFEKFQERLYANKSFNMLVHRPCSVEDMMMVDIGEDGGERQMLQPIFVVFSMDGTNLSNQAISVMIQRMEDWNQSQRDKNTMLELHEAILITNTQPTNAFKKVSAPEEIES